MVAFFSHSSLLTLFVVILIGVFLGTRSLKGISLGHGGIFLVALFFGHLGFKLPREVMDLGLVLFVYSVAIQVGPRFFEAFRKDGAKYAAIALVIVLVGAAATAILAILFRLPLDLALGMFSGSLTTTPALAAAIDMIDKLGLGDRARVSAGYGIAYPFSVVVTILFVQFLPKLLKKNLQREEEEWVEEQKSEHEQLFIKHFSVENPLVIGKKIKELHPHDIAPINISRIRRGRKEYPALPDIRLEEGDIITVVGTEADLAKLVFMFGAESRVGFLNKHVVSYDIEVTSPEFSHRSLKELNVRKQFGVVITRLRRQDFEIAPYGGIMLEQGDILRVVGDREDVERFAKVAGVPDARLEETSFIPFLAGLVFGLLLGVMPIPITSNVVLSLGAAGGALIAGILVSHMKRIGSMEMRVPRAALHITKELGLMIFLAGAGLVAGSGFVGVFREYGFFILGAGAFITLSALFSALFFMKMMNMGAFSIMGATSAGMTNPGALLVTSAQAKTILPTLIYASVYPFALIIKVIMVQLLLFILK